MIAIKRIGYRHYLLGTTLILSAGFAVCLLLSARRHNSAPRLAYTTSGYGGYTEPPSSPVAHKKHDVADPVQDMVVVYNKGDYRQAQSLAGDFLQKSANCPNPATKLQAAKVQLVLAYADARCHNLRLARTQFAKLRTLAATLPNHGAETSVDNLPAPTLEQEAAYEHAVCTAALGDKAGAEKEYADFMRHYPESPLVAGALKRAGWLMGGKIPPNVRDAWAFAQQKQREAGRDQAMCGPECVAELLRRRGQTVNVGSLAGQMGTSEQGTSLEAMSVALQREGYDGEGVALTGKGLAEQQLPVIALILPAHFVLVDAVAGSNVTVWDPDANGVGSGAERIYPLHTWKTMWHGIALTTVREELAQRG